MNLASTIRLHAYGTSEGATKAWDTRGRGQKAQPGLEKFDRTRDEVEVQKWFNEDQRGAKGDAAITLAEEVVLQNDDKNIRAVRQEGQLQALVSFYPMTDNYLQAKKGDLYLEGLAVRPSLQGQGIGTKVVEAVLQEAHQRGVGILAEANEYSAGMMRKLGFQDLGRDKFYLPGKVK